MTYQPIRFLDPDWPQPRVNRRSSREWNTFDTLPAADNTQHFDSNTSAFLRFAVSSPQVATPNVIQTSLFHALRIALVLFSDQATPTPDSVGPANIWLVGLAIAGLSVCFGLRARSFAFHLCS